MKTNKNCPNFYLMNDPNRASATPAGETTPQPEAASPPLPV
jgi:hypothetical protein